MGICELCKKPKKLIGTGRKNGKALKNSTGKDWDDRPYHKKCWKKELDWRNLVNRLKNIS